MAISELGEGGPGGVGRASSRDGGELPLALDEVCPGGGELPLALEVGDGGVAGALDAQSGGVAGIGQIDSLFTAPSASESASASASTLTKSENLTRRPDFLRPRDPLLGLVMFLRQRDLDL